MLNVAVADEDEFYYNKDKTEDLNEDEELPGPEINSDEVVSDGPADTEFSADERFSDELVGPKINAGEEFSDELVGPEINADEDDNDELVGPEINADEDDNDELVGPEINADEEVSDDEDKENSNDITDIDQEIDGKEDVQEGPLELSK